MSPPRTRAGKAGPGGARPRRRWTRRVWRSLAGLIAAALLLPAVQVLCVRWADPPLTGIEMQRRWEARRGGDPRGAQVARRTVGLGEVPDFYLRCLVTAEDSRFLQHRGVDFREMRAATARAKVSGKPVRGASTITMQCARTLFLWQGRSWVRKGLEMYYTLWMELLLPKRRILELYVNHIEMGRGIYGIRAAARHHYSREPWELSKDQLAMLAAILPAPRRWDPNAPTMRLRWRQTMIRVREPALRFPEWGRPAGGGR